MNELAGYNVGPYENTEDTAIKDLKKEIKSLKCRLTNALKQRDDWAMKYANAMSKKMKIILALHGRLAQYPNCR